MYSEKSALLVFKLTPRRADLTIIGFRSPSAARPREGMSPVSLPAGSDAGKGCRPWEVRGCRGFLQARKNPRPPGPRPVHALPCKPRDHPPALMRRGSHSHGATPFPHRFRPTDIIHNTLAIVLFLLPSHSPLCSRLIGKGIGPLLDHSLRQLSFLRQSGKEIGSFLDHSL